MKAKYYLILIVVVFSSCVNLRYMVENKETNGLYKIKEILPYSEFCAMIIAQRNDSVFLIISLKDSINSNLMPLQIGKKYKLNLTQICPNSIFEKRVDDAKIGARGSYFFPLYKKYHYSLYVANNLNGVFLLEKNKDTITENELSYYSIFCHGCKKNKFLLHLFFK